jgi:hypothetical protein
MSQDFIGTSGAVRQAAMNSSEREALQRLIRQREKVLKSAAKQRSADLLADFENQMGSIYSFDQDEVWAAATEVAEREVAKAQDRIAARCAEKGIPKRFAPSLDVHWYSRGENAVKARRDELRKMAVTRIAAIESKAIVEIEKGCLDLQTRIAVAGLTSDAARQFVEGLPRIETLMPALSVTEMAGEAEPPIAEQLVSANTLRQRRFRQRQAALRNATEALPHPSRNGGDEDDEAAES